MSKYDVYISYHTKHRLFVDVLVTQLTQQTNFIKVCASNDNDVIAHSKLFLVCYSKLYQQSSVCRNQLKLAKHTAIPVLVYKLELECEDPNVHDFSVIDPVDTDDLCSDVNVAALCAVQLKCEAVKLEEMVREEGIPFRQKTFVFERSALNKLLQEISPAKDEKTAAKGVTHRASVTGELLQVPSNENIDGLSRADLKPTESDLLGMVENGDLARNSIMIYNTHKEEFCVKTTKEVLLDMFASFYQTYNHLPRVFDDDGKDQVDKSPQRRSSTETDHSHAIVTIMEAFNSFYEMLDSNKEEIATRAHEWSDYVIIFALKSSKSQAVEMKFGKEQAKEKVMKTVFDLQHQTKDSTTVFVDFTKKLSALATNYLPLKIALMIIALRLEVPLMIQRRKYDQIKKFCGLRGYKFLYVDRYLEDNFYVILLKDHSDYVISSPYGVLSFFIGLTECASDKEVKNGRVVLSVQGDEYTRLLSEFKHRVDEFSLQIILKYFNIGISVPDKFVEAEDILEEGVVVGGNGTEIIPSSIAERNKVFINLIKRPFNELPRDTSEEDEKELRDLDTTDANPAKKTNLEMTLDIYDKIKELTVKSLVIKDTDIKRFGSTILFTYDYRLKFSLNHHYREKEGVHCIGLALCSTDTDPEVSKLLRTRAKIARFTCNKVRETVEESMLKVLDVSLQQCYRQYHYINDEEMFPFLPSEGFVPSCVEDWFAPNISIDSQRGSRLLLLDGGGVKGVIEATTLLLINYGVYLHCRRTKHPRTIADYIRDEKLCCEYKRTMGYPQIHELFDVIVGTSTGSLIAAGIARNGDNPIQLIKKFMAAADKIFPNSFCVKFRGTLRQMFTKTPKYDVTPLQEFLNNEFCGTPPNYPLLGVVTQKNSGFSSTGMRTILFESRLEDDDTIKSAVQASAAAPTYFRKMQIGADYFVDGGLGSNCPIKEGAQLVKDIATLEGEDDKGSEIMISLGCGYADSENADSPGSLPSYGLGWLNKTTSILTDAERNWEQYPDKSKYSVRLNPGRNFEVGKYDLADSARTTEMTLKYINLLKTPKQYDLPTYSSGDESQVHVKEFRVNEQPAYLSQGSFQLHLDRLDFVTIVLNKPLVERRLTVDKKQNLRVDKVKVVTDTNPKREYGFYRYKEGIIEFELKNCSNYGDTMRVIVLYGDEDDQNEIGCLNVRVDSEKAYLQEIERSAACIFAKNIYVFEANQNNLKQIFQQDQFGTMEYEDFDLELKFACLSGHRCVIRNIDWQLKKRKDRQSGFLEFGQKLLPSRDPAKSWKRMSTLYDVSPMHTNWNLEGGVTSSGDEVDGVESLGLFCKKCTKDEYNMEGPKKSVFVKKLQMEHDSSGDIQLIKVLQFTSPSERDNDVIHSYYKLRMRANMWKDRVCVMRFTYDGIEISGSPIKLKLSERNPDPLLRFMRPNLMSPVNPVELQMITPKDILKDGKDVVEVEDLWKYASKTSTKVVLVTKCPIYGQYFVQQKFHVVEPQEQQSACRKYMLVKHVKDSNKLRKTEYWVRDSYKEWNFNYFHILQQLRDIPKYKDEQEDDVMTKIRASVNIFSKKLCTILGYPKFLEEDRFSTAKISLLALAQAYRVRVILQTFSHRRQQYFIGRKYHVIEPRPRDYFVEMAVKSEEQNRKLEGVIFVHADEIAAFTKEGILNKYYSEKRHDISTPFITFEDIKKETVSNIGESASGEEYLFSYAEKNRTKIILLANSRKFEEYYIQKRSHVILPVSSEIKHVKYIHLEGLPNREETEERLRITNTKTDENTRGVLDEFLNQLNFLPVYRDETKIGMLQKLEARLNENSTYFTLLMGVREEYTKQAMKLKLITLAEIYSVKITLQSYNERLDQHYLRRLHHVIRPWWKAKLPVKGTIFINLDEYHDSPHKGKWGSIANSLKAI